MSGKLLSRIEALERHAGNGQTSFMAFEREDGTYESIKPGIPLARVFASIGKAPHIKPGEPGRPMTTVEWLSFAPVS
jgi:hypothetical protein